MLIEFSVKNFRTICNRATLSMVATSLKATESPSNNPFFHPNYPTIPLLRTAVIYGANAHGKTNFMLAIAWFRYLILNSTDIKLDDTLPYWPFAFMQKTLEMPTTFEIEFIAKDGVRYIYGFSYNRKEILSEYLYSFPNNNRKIEIFFREIGMPIKFGNSFKGPKKSLEGTLPENHLLLTKAANNRYEQFYPAYQYFKENYFAIHPKFDNDKLTKQLGFKDKESRQLIEKFMQMADTGISGIEIVPSQTDKKIADSIGNDIESLEKWIDLDVNVIHQPKYKGALPVKWPLTAESSGTQRLFTLVGPILDVLANGFVLPIDELSNHLHPHLTEWIVELFNSPSTNPKNAQLIFTTHDVSILKKENFRRDQVWFVEKDNEGASRLFSLGSFDKKDVRWDIPFDKWYLSGKFGATPLMGDFNWAG